MPERRRARPRMLAARVTQAEMDVVDQAAARAGLDRSTWLRLAALIAAANDRKKATP